MGSCPCKLLDAGLWPDSFDQVDRLRGRRRRRDRSSFHRRRRTSACGPSAVHRNETGIIIDTGRLRCAIPKRGGRHHRLDGGGRPPRRPRWPPGLRPAGRAGWRRRGYAASRAIHRPHRQGDRRAVRPVRAVVKIEGRHQGERSERKWLPFVVRLYFYAGNKSVRVVHSIIFDGETRTATSSAASASSSGCPCARKCKIGTSPSGGARGPRRWNRWWAARATG